MKHPATPELNKHIPKKHITTSKNPISQRSLSFNLLGKSKKFGGEAAGWGLVPLYFSSTLVSRCTRWPQIISGREPSTFIYLIPKLTRELQIFTGQARDVKVSFSEFWQVLSTLLYVLA